jgi:hypothetical protein
MSATPRILLAEPDPTEWLGRHTDIGIADYHRNTPGVSKSDLDNAHRSIAHYLAGKAAERVKTPAMAFGEAFHCRVLEPAKFEAAYVIAPAGIDRRTSKGKEAWAEWTVASAGKTSIDAEDAETITAMYESLVSHPIAGQLFVGGAAEHSFFWTDKTTDLLCKCRPDYLRPDRIAVDLKTAADASFSGFQRAVANYRYHVQAAFYADGIEAVTGAALDGFLFVAIEKEPPFAVAVYTLDQFAVQHGRLDYRDDLDRIAAHVASPAAWNGYPAEIQELQLPKWME